MTNEIILTPYQATVFNAAEALLRTQGYLGEALFEDTYVISKKLAQYVQSSIPQSNGTVSVNAMEAYNHILGVVTGAVSITGINANSISAEIQAEIESQQELEVSGAGGVVGGGNQPAAGRAVAPTTA